MDGQIKECVSNGEERINEDNYRFCRRQPIHDCPHSQAGHSDSKRRPRYFWRTRVSRARGILRQLCAAPLLR
jgi:hypothetical protein